MAKRSSPQQVLLCVKNEGYPVSLAEFLDHFPTVSRAQAVAALGQANDLLVGHAHSS